VPYTEPSWDPTVYKTNTTDFLGNGTTTTIGPLSPPGNPSGYVYSTNAGQLNQVAVDHRGYLFTPIAGEYTFHIDFTDDMTDFWLGPDAYSGWNRTNVFMELLYPDNAISKTATYNAAEWVPIRVMWGM
jgi:hypothetical protein